MALGDNHCPVPRAGGSALSRPQLCLLPWVGMVPLPWVWIEREAEGGMVSVQLEGMWVRRRGGGNKADCSQSPSPGPGLALTPLQADPDLGSQPIFCPVLAEL